MRVKYTYIYKLMISTEIYEKGCGELSEEGNHSNTVRTRTRLRQVT